MQYREFESPAIVMGEGKRMTKIVDDENCCQKKIEDHEVGLLFVDVYRHLAKPDDEADRPPSLR